MKRMFQWSMLIVASLAFILVFLVFFWENLSNIVALASMLCLAIGIARYARDLGLLGK